MRHDEINIEFLERICESECDFGDGEYERFKGI